MRQGECGPITEDVGHYSKKLGTFPQGKEDLKGSDCILFFLFLFFSFIFISWRLITIL